jgi:hypothetical protein
VVHPSLNTAESRSYVIVLIFPASWWRRCGVVVWIPEHHKVWSWCSSDHTLLSWGLLCEPPDYRRISHFYVFIQVFQSAFFMRVCFFWRKNKIVLASGRECHTKGWKMDGKGQKKNSIFFHCMCPIAVNSLRNCTCTARAVVHGITSLTLLPLLVPCVW